MRLTEINYPGQPPIDGYGPGFFRVGGDVHQGSVFVSEAGVAIWEDNWSAIPCDTFDVLLIGTGADIAFLPSEAKEHLAGQGIHFETMSSAAAARTYNVLLSEGRRVAALLMAA